MVLLDITNDYDWLSMASCGWCFDWNGVMILHVSSDEWQYCVGLPVLTRIGQSWLPILSHHQADAMLLHLSVCNDGVSFLSVIWESCLSSCAWSQLESGSVGMRLDWQYAPIMFFVNAYCTYITTCNQWLSWWNRCRPWSTQRCFHKREQICWKLNRQWHQPCVPCIILMYYNTHT